MEKSSYTSDELFHLVGRRLPADHEANFNTLVTILKAGCISYPPDFPRKWELRLTYREDRSLLSEDLVIPTITCYCDIPANQLSLHAQKYGLFGVSFGRDFLIERGARPVIYVPIFNRDFLSVSGRALLVHIEQVYRGFRELVVDPIPSGDRSYKLGTKPESGETAIQEMDSIVMMNFPAFLKPFNAELSDDHIENYYLEREWRKFGCLEFTPKDVQHVLVARGYIQRLIEKFPAYAEKILILQR